MKETMATRAKMNVLDTDEEYDDQVEEWVLDDD